MEQVQEISRGTAVTASSASSTEGSALARLARLPVRLDDATLNQVEVYAASPPPALPQADETMVLQFSRMMADMPRQGMDAVSGTVKTENMQRHLGHLPRPCVNWMMDVVHARFTFYPSIKELLELAAEWRRDDEAVRARAKAAVRARDERLARLDDARRALRAGTLDQDAVDSLPERTLAILTTDGLLWRCPGCGSHTARPVAPTTQLDDDLSGALGRMAAKFESAR